MARCVLPPGGVESRMVEAKLCNSCGYFHDREHAKADRCDHCGTLLDGAHSQYIPTLFEMGTVRGFRVERITCDEEERLREGFEIETRYRFAPAPDGRALQQQANVRDPEGRELLQLTFAPQAELWRVNQRWRRSDRPGFTLDTRTGYWARRPDDDDRAPDAAGGDLRTGIRPFVRDTRNVLLARPTADGLKVTDQFLAGVGHAYQVTDDIVQFTRAEGRAVVGGHQRLRTVFQSLEIRLRDKVKSAVQSLQLERKIVFVANYAHIFLTAPTGRRHRSRLMIAVRRGVGDRLADLLHRMSASVR